MIPESEIGKNIRKFRKETGLSLGGLAKLAGFTKGYLSKVENSTKAPPVSTLITIAEKLGVTISDIFGESNGNPSITMVKKSERVFMARDGSRFGYSYEPLAHNFPGRHMEPYILTTPVDADTEPMFQHRGEELYMVLQGTVRFVHGEKEFLVEEGDCLYFDASIPHRGLVVGDKVAISLIVIYTPLDDDMPG